MSKIRLTTAGESHGPWEICVVEGIPAGLPLSADDIDTELARRQKGYGRGGRMTIETDRCEVLAGVRLGVTIGSPIAILVPNADHKNWTSAMRTAGGGAQSAAASDSSVPRPGHADFAGMAKYHQYGIRPILERASARETVARVAGGAVCRRLLAELGVTVRGRVVSIGEVSLQGGNAEYTRPESIDWEAVEASVMACEDASLTQSMRAAVDAARDRGDSLGGVFEIWAWGLCPGLGSHVSSEERLDGRLLGAMGSIPGVKGAEIGCAFRNATLPGSQVHDVFMVEEHAHRRGIIRPTNRAGGLEGGMTNGMPVVIRAAMKPIPTLTEPLASVDVATLEASRAHVERSDVTAVPAARVVGEAMVAHVLAGAYLDKFGGDSLVELLRSAEAYGNDLEGRGLWRRS